MRTMLRYLLLAAVAGVGVLVMVCGLGLALGFYRISVFGFFGSLALLGLLRLVVSVLDDVPPGRAKRE